MNLKSFFRYAQNFIYPRAKKEIFENKISANIQFIFPESFLV